MTRPGRTEREPTVSSVADGPGHDQGPGSWQGYTVRICAVILCAYIAFGAVVPLLPGLVLRTLDGGKIAVGLMLTVSSLTSLASRPYFGRLAQRRGSRPVIISGCLLGAAGGAIYALPLGIAGLLMARAVTGLAIAAMFTAGAVWITALAPASRRGLIVGWYGLAGWAGMGIGPVVGQSVEKTGGTPALWWLAALLPLLAITAVPRGSSAVDPLVVRRSLVPRAALLPGAALSLGACGYAALFGFIVPYVQVRGMGDGSAMLAVFALGYVAARLCFGSLPDRVGGLKMTIACAGCEAIGLGSVTTAHTWWLSAAGVLLTAAGISVLFPTLALQVINRASPEERGAALGAYISFWDLGLAGGGLIAGVVAGLGYQYVFGAATALAVLGGLVAATTQRGLARRYSGPVQKA